MVYFTEEYNNFFKSLAANNYREWFHEHKSVYESAVKKPFEKFISDLIAEIAKYEPEQKKLTADRKSTRLNSSHLNESRMPSSA